MSPLTLAAPRCSLGAVPLGIAVHLSAVARAAQVEHLPTVIDDALDLPKIVHAEHDRRELDPPSDPCDNSSVERGHPRRSRARSFSLRALLLPTVAGILAPSLSSSELSAYERADSISAGFHAR
jgi:hypothetical protein